MSKVPSQKLAQVGQTTTQSAVNGNTIPYSQLDCQGYMEHLFKLCGLNINYAGSNDMIRNAVSWVGTIAEAKKLGYLVPGAALFILRHDGNEPAKYQTDGIGNASHVGLYLGKYTVRDVDKNGNSRTCDACHSSASMGRVAGTALQNGWTHVGLWKHADYGLKEDNDMAVNNDVDMGEEVLAEHAVVKTENGAGVNFRTKTSTKAALVPKIPKIPEGAIVEINYERDGWAHITYKGIDGFVKAEFLKMTENESDTETPVFDSYEDLDDTDDINVTGILAYLDSIRDLCDHIEKELGIVG